VVLASSATSVPPFYLVTALAGALGLPLRDFLVAGSVGAAIRFTALLTLARAL
jgi:membrane protein YqaA with SNARE-associated domain